MADCTRVYLRSVLAWLLSLVSVVASERCSYMSYGYNELDGRFEQMISYKHCRWGCCWKFKDPCCSAPVALIVGCVIGGLLCLVLFMVAICCCFCCKRRNATPGVIARYPAQTGTGVSISTTHMQNQSAIPTSLPPGVYQPPPSYEEVMAGQFNPAFKHSDNAGTTF